MTEPLDLGPIKARLAACDQAVYVQWGEPHDIDAEYDIERLLAEVERLQPVCLSDLDPSAED